MKKLTLEERLDIARKDYGFTKGISWWQVCRVLIIIGVIYTLLENIGSLNQNLSVAPFVWIYLLIWGIFVGLYMYAIYVLPKRGYLFVLLYFLFNSITNLLLNVFVIGTAIYVGDFQTDMNYFIGNVISLIWFPAISIINIIYFRNRRILFSIEQTHSRTAQPTISAAAVPLHNRTTQGFEYNKDIYTDSKSNIDYQMAPTKAPSSASESPRIPTVTPPLPKRKSGKGKTAVIVLSSVALIAVIIGVSVYVGIQIGESKNPNRHANDISVTESSSKPTDYIAKDYKKTVYVIEENGNWSYHDSDCEIISGIPYSINSMTKQEAEKYGYHRCTKCKP